MNNTQWIVFPIDFHYREIETYLSERFFIPHGSVEALSVRDDNTVRFTIRDVLSREFARNISDAVCFLFLDVISMIIPSQTKFSNNYIWWSLFSCDEFFSFLPRRTLRNFMKIALWLHTPLLSQMVVADHFTRLNLIIIRYRVVVFQFR